MDTLATEVVVEARGEFRLPDGRIVDRDGWDIGPAFGEPIDSDTWMFRRAARKRASFRVTDPEIAGILHQLADKLTFRP